MDNIFSEQFYVGYGSSGTVALASVDVIFSRNIGPGTWENDGATENLYSGDERTYATFTVVPIPAAVWLLGGGLIGLLGLRRRLKN